MLCGGREAISYDVLEQADEQRSFPAVHAFTQKKRKKGTQKKVREEEP